jgi:hypothetical protein
MRKSSGGYLEPSLGEGGRAEDAGGEARGRRDKGKERKRKAEKKNRGESLACEESPISIRSALLTVSHTMEE